MVAEVIINSTVKNLNRIFDYKIPEELEEKVSIGSRVLLPFGNKKELEEGFVVNLKETSEYINKLKEIAKVEEKNYLSREKVEMAKWMAYRYFCNVSDCLKLMFPPGKTTKNTSNRVNDKMQNFVYLAKDVEEVKQNIEEGKIKSEKQRNKSKFCSS